MRLTKNNIDKAYDALLYFLGTNRILISWDGVFHVRIGLYDYCLDSDNKYLRPALSNKLYKKLNYGDDFSLRSLDVVANDIGVNEIEIKRDIINVLRHHKNLVAQDDFLTTIKRYGSLPSIEEMLVKYDLRNS